MRREGKEAERGGEEEKNGTIATWQILLNASIALKTTNQMLATVQ